MKAKITKHRNRGSNSRAYNNVRIHFTGFFQKGEYYYHEELDDTIRVHRCYLEIPKNATKCSVQNELIIGDINFIAPPEIGTYDLESDDINEDYIDIYYGNRIT